MDNPYQVSAPSLKHSVEPTDPNQSPYLYRPANLLTPALKVLYALMVPLMAAMGISVLLIEQVNVQDPAALDMALLFFAAVVGITVVALFLTTMVTHCIWTNRMNKNARALGARDMETTPGWAVAYFFIPIVHLFKPFVVASEIYRASEPGQDEVGWQDEPTPMILKCWWGFWIVGHALDRVAGPMSNMAVSAVITMAASFLMSAAAACAFVWVGRVHRRQLRTYATAQASAVQAVTL